MITSQLTKLPELLNVIKSLEVSGYISKHSIDATNKMQYNQLPFDLSCSYVVFDNAINNPDFKSLDALEKFNLFLRDLAKFACLNYGETANAETNQAEFLLSFLLAQNFHLGIDNKIVALKTLIEANMPVWHRLESNGQKIQVRQIPEYDFLLKEKRDAMNLPDLNTLSVKWNAHLENERKTKEAQEKMKLRQKQLMEQSLQDLEAFKAQLNAYVKGHYFSDMTMSFEKFTYALEGFAKLGNIQFANNPFDSRAKLSPELMMLNDRFVQLARPRPFRFLQAEDAKAFTLFMKTLIATAKVVSPYQAACDQLLGFMLYHNFQIQYQNQTFKISDIISAEISQQEFQRHLQTGKQYLPFLNADWRAMQKYPGKTDLEKALSVRPLQGQPIAQHQVQSFAPMFNQWVFPTASQPQQPLPMDTQATVQNVFSAVANARTSVQQPQTQNRQQLQQQQNQGVTFTPRAAVTFNIKPRPSAPPRSPSPVPTAATLYPQLPTNSRSALGSTRRS
ncbi:MAG: hypothetical protein JSS07_08710 [Proteobacteria bacterium]|nr:hypothetical protein [Pseudomonadota bacterium]